MNQTVKIHNSTYRWYIVPDGWGKVLAEISKQSDRVDDVYWSVAKKRFGSIFKGRYRSEYYTEAREWVNQQLEDIEYANRPINP